MITVNLKDGGKFDLPPESILMLEEDQQAKKGCTIVYSLEQGKNTAEELTDAYGFVKKLWLDQVPGANVVEVTIAAETNHKLTVPVNTIIARRELTEAENGAKTRLTLNVNGAIITVPVIDSRDSLVTGE